MSQPFKFTGLLNILYANVNSYIPKKHIICNFVEQNNINCTLFVETKTKSASNTVYRNWDVIQRNGNIVNNARGGSLVQLCPTLKMRKENAPSINNPLDEVTHFSIPFLNDKLHIFLVYIHHSSNNIEDTILTKAALCKYALIIGDFNVNKRREKQIKTFIENTTFRKAITPPTFIMENNNDSTPDLILYTHNLENNIRQIETHPDIGSDHLAIQLILDLNTSNVQVDEEFKINYHKCDMEKVNNDIKNYIKDQHSPINKETINEFNNKLTDSIIQHSPKVKINHYIHELPPFIIRLLKNKRKMYREYRQNQNASFKRELNLYNKNIHTLIQQYKENKWIEACSEINNQTGKNYWYQIRKLSRYKTKSIIPHLEDNGQIFSTDSEKAERFAKHFEKAFQKSNDIHFDQNQYEQVTSWYKNFFESDMETENHKINEDTYFEIINQGKSTTPGEDNITKKCIRHLDHEIHLYIIKCYEYCLNNHYFPDKWKQGTLITIAKPNTDHSKASNYRPITLLSVLAKNFEKIIKSILYQHIRNKIPNHQFGFQEKRSTVHPLTILVSNIQTARLTGQNSAAIFLDINKAFDSVWHEGLLYKLYLLNCPKYLLYVIKDYLNNRFLRVKVNSEYSTNFSTQQGVPQGSPLSPLLYNIYCHDIYTNEDHNTFNDNLYILQYADDTALVSHNSSITSTLTKLQQLMDRTLTWFNLWRLKANPLKSQLIVFNHSQTNNSPTISINGQIVENKPTANYLGMHLDHKLNFNHHTKLVKKKCITRGKHFRSLTYKNKGINKKTAAHIYKSICRPILEYAHPLYLNCRKPARKNLEVAETSTIRSVTKIRHPGNPLHNPPNNLLYQTTNIKPISQRLIHLSTKFAKNEQTLSAIQPLCKTREHRPRYRYRYPEKTILELIEELN